MTAGRLGTTPPTTDWLASLAATFVTQASLPKYPDATTTATVVPRPVWIDVRDKGAAVNGVTVDTTAVQTAVDDCSTAGGGVVFLPGMCKVTTVTSKPRVTLRSIGAVFGGAGAPQGGLLGTPSVDTVLLGTPGGAYTEAMKFEDLTIKGGKRGIVIDGHGVTNLVLRDVSLTGVEAGFYCNYWLERSLFERVESVGSQIAFHLVDNGTINNYVDKTAWRSIRAHGTLNAFNFASYRACNSITIQDLVTNACGETAMKFAAPMSYLTVIGYASELNGLAGPTPAFTTGSIAALSSSLVVADATDLVIGQALTVGGAGTTGLDLAATISGIAGTTITLSTPAVTTVALADVTNAIHDDWQFNPSSSGGLSTPMAFVACHLGPGGSADRLRYAIGGTAAFASLLSCRWTRPVQDQYLRGSFRDCTGPVRQPFSAAGADGMPSVLVPSP